MTVYRKGLRTFTESNAAVTGLGTASAPLRATVSGFPSRALSRRLDLETGKGDGCIDRQERRLAGDRGRCQKRAFLGLESIADFDPGQHAVRRDLGGSRVRNGDVDRGGAHVDLGTAVTGQRAAEIEVN